MLPPGRGRLATKPLPTGSLTPLNTIGTFPAIGLRISSAKLVNVTATSGERAISSAAQTRICSGWSFHHCTCMTRLRPSRHPSSSSRCKRAAIQLREEAVSAAPINTAMRRTPSTCCARTATGHAAAAPPSSVMHSGKKVNLILTISKTDPNGHYLVFVVRQDKLKVNRDAYVRAMAALIDAARFIHDLKNADRVAADAVITGHTAAVSKATIKPLLDIDYWPVDDDGLDQPRLERLIALMKKVGGIKTEKEPVKYDRLVDQTVWHDAIELAKKH